MVILIVLILYVMFPSSQNLQYPSFILFVFSVLICHGKYSFWSCILFSKPLVSICISVSFSRFGKFSFMILFKMLSLPLIWNSPSAQLVTCRFGIFFHALFVLKTPFTLSEWWDSSSSSSSPMSCLPHDPAVDKAFQWTLCLIEILISSFISALVFCSMSVPSTESSFHTPTCPLYVTQLFACIFLVSISSLLSSLSSFRRLCLLYIPWLFWTGLWENVLQNPMSWISSNPFSLGTIYCKDVLHLFLLEHITLTV